jgi:hypothetical protein
MSCDDAALIHDWKAVMDEVVCGQLCPQEGHDEHSGSPILRIAVVGVSAE